MQEFQKTDTPNFVNYSGSSVPFNIDAIILSDLHLGSTNCRALQLSAFLQKIVHQTLRPRELVLNGDVFDSMDFRRLKKHHWNVLSLLRKLSDKVPITWVCGNHDGPAEMISHLLGVSVVDLHTVQSGGQKVLILHGHQFDDFVETHPGITWLADLVYRFLQYIDRSHRIARFAKTNSKVFLRCTEKVRLGAINYAKQILISKVCCGHTHHPELVEGDVQYANSGSWTEYPSTYLSISQGAILLHRFEEATITESKTPLTEQYGLLPEFAQ
ncbi:MAG: UDP-2,3-diacylglucosamine diphosphatase [Bacteroidota bacterium]